MDIDLSNILAQSRATTAVLSSTAHPSADQIPRLERALPQIAHHSHHLPTPPTDPTPALRLLSSHGVDTQRLERGLGAASLLLAPGPPTIPHAHLDAHLASDLEASVVDAISSALARVHDASVASVAASRDAEWRAAKRDLVALPTLAVRRPGVPAASPGATAPGGVFASPFRAPRASARVASPRAKCVYEGVVSAAVHARARPAACVGVATAMDDALVGALPRGEVETAPKGVQHLHAVFTALRYMSGEDGGLVVEGAFGGLYGVEERRQVALGAVRYLALQFREDKMRREVEARPREAARGGVPGIVGDVRAYLKLSFDRGVPPQLENGPCIAGLPLWPQVYFCMRAGDFDAALSVLEDVLTEGTTTSASVVLFRDCLLAYIESGDRRVLSEEMLSRLVHDYGMSVYRGGDNYHRVCCVVLSRLDPAAGEKMALTPEDYSLLFFSIEDYLWLRLIIARLDGDPAPPGALASYGLSMRDIQGEIAQFGPAHFDERGDSPVFYALILLLCGDFAGAINYLAGGPRAVTEAMHIAFVLYHYGMIRAPEHASAGGGTPLIGRTNGFMASPSHAPPSPSGSLGGERGDADSNCLTVRYGELVWQYVSQFLADDPASAALYLFTLRDAPTRNEFMKKLILESGAFDILLGTGPVVDHNRAQGVLASLWPLGGTAAMVDGNDWVSVVSRAALAAERRGDRTAAAALHDITGATDKVVELYMNALSSEMTSRGSKVRDKFLADAQAYQKVLHHRSGQGMSSGSPVALKSLNAVVQLSKFFDVLWAQKSSADLIRAWSIVKNIGILPANGNELHAKVREASVSGGAWTAAVCDRVPDVVVGAMECLAGLHGARRGASDIEVVQNDAHVLVNFASLLPNATADMSARLIRLEVLMS